MSEVILQIEEKVAVITISSPDVRNALTPEMGRQLSEICETIDHDESIGAAVVRGAEGTFCSGADTRHWGEDFDPASPSGFAEMSAIYSGFARVGQLAVPTTAAVRGVAVGAGLNLALATDLRIVATGARLFAGFSRIGIHPGGGFFTLSGRLGGREAASALGIFGEEISGEQAVRLGIAWEALPDEAVERKAMAMAAYAAADPELVRQVVATFRAELGPPAVSWPAAIEMERGKQMWTQRRRQTRRTLLASGRD
jgi:enoyl-CoA hydratase